ncbi:MAG: hypothetical protein KTR19_10975 [Hyphomicrobiales bacterium]|nr:hypothetical protein [Hyphomicrobiales bacterium]
MTAEAVLGALLQTKDQVDNQWSMYVVVHLGLFWFFFLVHRPLLFIERAIALFAYGAFAYINGSALIDSYTFLEAARLDLLNLRGELVNIPNMGSVLGLLNFAVTTQLILITHGAAFGVVALFLIFRNSMVRRYQRLFEGGRTAN